MDEEYLYEEPKSEGRGRTAKKREAKAVEKLAERLISLSEAEFSGLPLTGELRTELVEVRQTKGHSSRKRSMKHFAGQLRRDDAVREALQTAVEQLDSRHNQDAAVHHDLETLRDRLCSSDGQEGALREVLARYPAVDLKALQRLINSVQQHNDKRAFREIFRRLRDAE